jgi:hypothetical protein
MSKLNLCKFSASLKIDVEQEKTQKFSLLLNLDRGKVTKSAYYSLL